MKKEENIICNGNKTELYNLQKALDKMAKDLFDKNVEDERFEYDVDSDFNIINLGWTGTKQDAILYRFLKNQKMLLSFRMTLLGRDTDIDFSMLFVKQYISISLYLYIYIEFNISKDSKYTLI